MGAECPDVGPLQDDELIRDGHMMNMADVLLVTGVVSHISLLPLAAVDETRANVLWDTLNTLSTGLDLHPVSTAAQTSMVEAWNAYETELQEWESAPPVFPRWPPVRLDRYRSRMQEIAGPIIQGITGE